MERRSSGMRHRCVCLHEGRQRDSSRPACSCQSLFLAPYGFSRRTHAKGQINEGREKGPRWRNKAAAAWVTGVEVYAIAPREKCGPIGRVFPREERGKRGGSSLLPPLLLRGDRSRLMETGRRQATHLHHRFTITKGQGWRLGSLWLGASTVLARRRTIKTVHQPIMGL
jgi:hypothetical protein